ncbi:Protein TALPID3 [Caenorhabditis elegans]|uniref:Protein TALPID3 n=1 Tax=Caenorhabditis elegans TaxID=6239 RepID=H2KYD9_CAEEL|nr:Protein TALPID3 [Caenorhabditis elegans]CCD62596.1 Protein TALPID3 [Caenorhabditis elegans]|eukprot:NP_504337.2 Uncharacterized protein CELE_F26G5.1 [Caenorhabditis elegans]
MDKNFEAAMLYKICYMAQSVQAGVPLGLATSAHRSAPNALTATKTISEGRVKNLLQDGTLQNQPISEQLGETRASTHSGSIPLETKNVNPSARSVSGCSGSRVDLPRKPAPPADHSNKELPLLKSSKSEIREGGNQAATQHIQESLSMPLQFKAQTAAEQEITGFLLLKLWRHTIHQYQENFLQGTKIPTSVIDKALRCLFERRISQKSDPTKSLQDVPETVNQPEIAFFNSLPQSIIDHYETWATGLFMARQSIPQNECQIRMQTSFEQMLTDFQSPLQPMVHQERVPQLQQLQIEKKTLKGSREQGMEQSNSLAVHPTTVQAESQTVSKDSCTPGSRALQQPAQSIDIVDKELHNSPAKILNLFDELPKDTLLKMLQMLNQKKEHEELHQSEKYMLDSILKSLSVRIDLGPAEVESTPRNHPAKKDQLGEPIPSRSSVPTPGYLTQEPLPSSLPFQIDKTTLQQDSNVINHFAVTKHQMEQLDLRPETVRSNSKDQKHLDSSDFSWAVDQESYETDDEDIEEDYELANLDDIPLPPLPFYPRVRSAPKYIRKAALIALKMENLL